MRKISEKSALDRLAQIRDEFAATVRSCFEHRAKSCETCETKGACCLDEHFVNVRITRLEAVAITQEIGRLSPIKRAAIRTRIENAVERYDLKNENNVRGSYACPLFESAHGCLVHKAAKPLPCISHACYENENDLPPEHLLHEQEGRVERLNRKTYSEHPQLLPLPVALETYG